MTTRREFDGQTGECTIICASTVESGWNLSYKHNWQPELLMPDLDAVALARILHALLLIQLDEIDESKRLPLLIRAGWSNAEIAGSFGMTENAVAVRRTRLKQKPMKGTE